ncbi:MAG: hypothetical protein ABR980_02845 [Ignavibacteriaceae bacterium]|jgi:hypothetical protein
MILDIVLNKTDDGCIVSIPSIKGCECWAHNENTAMDKILELAAYYLKTDINKFKLDKARGTRNKIIYKLVFNKSN